MVRHLRDETLVAKWKTFFENGYKPELETIAATYPHKKSIYVDYINLDKYDPEIANQLLNNPYEYLFNAEQAIEEIDTASEYKLKLHVRLKNLTGAEKIPIRNKSAVHLGKIRTIEGVIRKQTDVKMKALIAAFQCSKCGTIINVEQSEDILKEPSECYESEGGCGKASSFKFLPNLSMLVDCMKIQVQECTDDISGQNQPKNLSVYLEDDLINPMSLTLGDRISVTGVFKIVPKYRGSRQLATSDFSFDTLSYDIKETSYHTIEITDEDIAEIKKNSNDPLIYDKLIQSVAPTIYGLDVEKEAIILQLFGCQRITMPDGTKVRGDSHILFIGDPGCAKSQLLRRATKIAPKGIFTTGTSSTAAGLTAAAVKDEFSEGQWSLEAGALVLADMGVVAVDELDKMDEHDRNSLHTAMEQQCVPVNKAGINTELPARCSILAAANPKLGCFDEFMPVHEQINLPSTLLSRFDLIFTVLDKPNKKGDSEKAEHVLRSRQNSESYEPIKPFFSEDFIRKYIVYAKQNCNPVLSDDTLNKLKDFYVETRGSSDANVTITIRQLEALIRLSTASARIRLSDMVSVDDADRAIRIYSQYIGRVGTDWETGKPDIQKIAAGVSHSQQDRMKKILGVIKDLCGREGHSVVDKSLILEETDIVGIESGKVEEALEKLKSQKMIYEVNGRYGVNN
jgi:replicative DNA helicase Mcm